MLALTGSVGEKGANNISDIALVQAILVKTQRAATHATPESYLKSYDGVFGKDTKAAILAFQTDYVFVSNDGMQCVDNPMATTGLVAPNDATWAKLVEKVATGFSDMRVLKGGKTVYIAATAAQLQAKIVAANALTFAPAFRAKVITCINRMHTLYGIALGVCTQGDRRDFQTQYNLLTGGTGVTNAGPGESNHNFGMAVDIGLEGLRWLQSNGTVIENETSWLHRLHAVSASEELKFWDLLRSVGTSVEVGTFRGPLNDRPHLQNWDDAGVNMSVRLADLLTRSGTMRWSATRGVYSSDLGMGGNLYALGTAAQIWNRQATVTVDMLTRARAAQTARPGQQRPGMPLTASSRQMQPGNSPPVAPQLPPVTQADVVAMQRELRRQFELADANWKNWTPR